MIKDNYAIYCLLGFLLKFLMDTKKKKFYLCNTELLKLKFDLSFN